MAGLELFHCFYGGVVPFAAGGAAERAVLGQGLLNFGDALGGWRFLALLSLGALT